MFVRDMDIVVFFWWRKECVREHLPSDSRSVFQCMMQRIIS